MKKYIISFVLIIVLIIAAAAGMKSFLLSQKRKGTYYYTKITQLSESRTEEGYLYRLDGFDKNGKKSWSFMGWTVSRLKKKHI
ncbi:hypothetical protein [Anaerostipes sp.]|uniref:hypothetical protein n=1 Tax=Anaerostipes sp. TaxID=1872530 RepID=UPI0025BA7C1C|nr:hypothetical protein [Anaerostipes sp.]MBS7009855.1 hypothetical protein [Anaerostipes sp.]